MGPFVRRHQHCDVPALLGWVPSSNGSLPVMVPFLYEPFPVLCFFSSFSRFRVGTRGPSLWYPAVSSGTGKRNPAEAGLEFALLLTAADVERCASAMGRAMRGSIPLLWRHVPTKAKRQGIQTGPRAMPHTIAH